MTISAELADEAREALTGVVAARQTESGWERTDRIVAQLRAAVRAGDEPAVQDAIVALDQVLRRVKEKLGEEPELVEASAQTRDRANETIHDLTPPK